MIYLVRHGEAAASWGDHPDPGLNALGHKQAEAVAQLLLEKQPEALFSSPMQRCRETSMPLSRELGITPEIVPEVSEIDTPDGVDDRVTWLRDLMAGTWPSDAVLESWRQNMLAKVSGLPDSSVVFTHFVAINALVGQLERVPDVLVFRPGHCSVTALSKTADGLTVAAKGSEAATRVL